MTDEVQTEQALPTEHTTEHTQDTQPNTTTTENLLESA